MRDTAPMDTGANTDPTITRHDDRGRYELDIGGEVVSFVEFSQNGDVVTIPYIETAVRHRNRGYSSMLMDEVIDDLRRRGLQVRATCPVARAHIATHAAELLVR
jgi:predicted GNAT family acetyltransferase